MWAIIGGRGLLEQAWGQEGWKVVRGGEPEATCPKEGVVSTRAGLCLGLWTRPDLVLASYPRLWKWVRSTF